MKSNLFLTLILIFSMFGISISQTLESEQQRELKQREQQMDIPAPSLDFSTDILKLIEPGSNYLTTDLTVLEGPVDQNKYIVGPNDIFALGIWGALNQTIPVQVTPEGSIVIPSVGEVTVAGSSLAEAKSRVISKVRTRFISGDITLTLTSPRKFSVTVSGVGQGIYPVSAVTRASSLIAYIITDSLSLSKSGTSFNEKTRFSVRNITLTRKNGTVMRLDMHKYYANRDEKYNPFLLEGDILNIPKYDIDGRFLSVYGAVQFPNTFEYIEGDDLETAIQLVRGFTTSAEPDSIMISRLDMTANKMNNFYVKYDENKSMKLQMNDRVMVQSYVDQRRDFKVLVLGEVRRPGNFPITANTTRLSEVLMEAGGFNEFAYLPTSEIYRKLDTLNLPFNEQGNDSLELYFTMRLNDVIANKEERQLFEEETNGRIGRVNVDFERLFLKNDLSQDIILRDGDVIFINNKKNVVYVYGQVNTPGYVTYEENADFETYIEKAGGLGDRADDEGIRIIKFKTRQWIDPENAKIEAGDFVYVPKIIKRDFSYDIDLIAKIASVIASIVTITLLIIQTQK